jgi:elongin-A
LSAIGNIRRQTAEAARNRAIQPTRGSDSAIKLSAAKQQIKQAPASMVGESRRIQPRKLLPHEQAIMADHQRNSGQTVTIRAPRAVNRNGTTNAAAAASAIAAAEEKKRQGNEAKLRALTSAPKATFEYGNAEESMRELEKAHVGLSSPPKQPSTLKRKRPAAEVFMAKKHQK